MKSVALGVAAACLAVGLAAAQTTTNNGPATVNGPATNTGTTATSTGTHTGTSGVLGAVGVNPHDRAAASGDNNQAVATTDANAPQPAHGSNSFTAAQARGRIQDQGFANVTDLRKDNSGVWRGHAQKNGETVNVWLDYKGNVGQ